jgi:hypothetical protein
MMTRARKTAPKSETSLQRQQSHFASRPFAPRTEEHEAPAGESRVGFSIADLDIFPRETVQPKLRLGPVGDRYEQEADRIAGHVVETISSSDQGHVQRIEDVELRRKVAGFGPAGSAEIGPDVESAIHKARSGGQPLPEGVRLPMERAFGADFGGVRVHADGEADSLNRSIQARAFTTGEDIFLRQGEYRPASSEGQRLLAHELTHVVQQAPAKGSQELEIKRRTAKSYTAATVNTIRGNSRQNDVIQRWPTPEVNDEIKMNLVPNYKCHDAVVYWILKSMNVDEGPLEVLKMIHRGRSQSMHWVAEALGYDNNSPLSDDNWRKQIKTGDILFVGHPKMVTHSMVVTADNGEIKGFNNYGTFGTEKGGDQYSTENLGKIQTVERKEEVLELGQKMVTGNQFYKVEYGSAVNRLSTFIKPFIRLIQEERREKERREKLIEKYSGPIFKGF